MSEASGEMVWLVLLVGVAIVLSILSKSGLRRLGVPALIGSIVLGFLLRLCDARWELLSESGYTTFRLLADLGLIALLFRVGLESNLPGLISQIGPAARTWIGNVGISGLLGFVTAYWLLDLGTIASLVIATALTATSVGVSVAVWQEAGALDTSTGQWLIDVAELDDVSGVLLMAVLFALLPAMTGSAPPAEVSQESMHLDTLVFPVFLAAAILLFGSLIFRELRRPMGRWFRTDERLPEPMLRIAAVAIGVAALAALFGVAMVALFNLLPAGPRDGFPIATLLKTLGRFAFLFALFLGFCYVFTRRLEERMTRWFRQLEPMPDPMLLVVGVGFVIAALAGFMGFSIAIGAFFAGLVFSRDPEMVQIDASFSSLYDLFSPFFFIGIGLSIDPSALLSALGPGTFLLVAAVVGKVAGTAVPALLSTDWRTSLLLGIGMVPRAEIAMVIVERGRAMGSDVVPPEVFSAMVLVVLGTCLIAPLSLRPLLRQWLRPKVQGDFS
ncbi:cation:proton antiporter [Tautonia marina]|uniref:cation:proton antiporter n=1 Tax=Tautonia marina TaxID=2653855 RepID=UPI0012607C8A|nr:cation:proton antiporter [Tautonia marina]